MVSTSLHTTSVPSSPLARFSQARVPTETQGSLTGLSQDVVSLKFQGHTPTEPPPAVDMTPIAPWTSIDIRKDDTAQRVLHMSSAWGKRNGVWYTSQLSLVATDIIATNAKNGFSLLHPITSRLGSPPNIELPPLSSENMNEAPTPEELQRYFDAITTWDIPGVEDPTATRNQIIEAYNTALTHHLEKEYKHQLQSWLHTALATMSPHLYQYTINRLDPTPQNMFHQPWSLDHIHSQNDVIQDARKIRDAAASMDAEWPWYQTIHGILEHPPDDVPVPLTLNLAPDIARKLDALAYVEHMSVDQLITWWVKQKTRK